MQEHVSRYETGATREPVASSAEDARNLGSLIKELRDESTALFRQEVALAKTEISEKVSRVTRNVVYLAVGALVAFAGVIVLLIAAGEGLAVGLAALGMEANALWLGPLIVGAIVAAIGGGLVMKGKNTLQDESIVPERTAESMKENKEWVKSKAK